VILVDEIEWPGDGGHRAGGMDGAYAGKSLALVWCL